MEILKRNKGITLIALVITIIILLILAGVAISSLGGENGLFANVQRAKKAQIKAEMREQLVLALQELQLEKKGDATLDDVTQEWADSILEDYEPIVSSDASISGKKVTMSKGGVTGRYIIDEKLNIVETEETSTGAQLTYEVKSRDGENLQVLVTVTDNENGLEKIEYNDGHIQEANGLKTVSRDCTIQIGVEYKVKITSKSGEEKTETILINEYYHTITKNLGEGIEIDNTAIKAEYNKSYTATLTTGEEYILDTFTVTMGGQAVEVDKVTGVINIEKVTGDIEITATTKKLGTQVTTPILTSHDENLISSGYKETFPEWQAFNGVTYLEQGRPESNGWEDTLEEGKQTYLGYNFNRPIKLKKVSIWGPQQNNGTGYYMIYTGALQGSNDYTNGSTSATWEDIQSFSFDKSATALYNELIVNTEKKYSAYRIIAYTGQGRYNFVQISEMKMEGVE